MNCARVQEGEQPTEDPTQLPAELRANHQRLLDLVTRINRTNSTTFFEPETGATLSDALSQRDHLAALRANLSRVVDGTIRADRMTRSEVKYVPTVSIRDLQIEADATAQAHRKLDSRIQELNWATDLIS